MSVGECSVGDFLRSLFDNISVWELILIFASRIIEVAMGTLRIILISKGYRRQGVIISFFEVTLWVFVASRVITSLYDAPIKALVYSLGFATGVYVGSKLENRLAFGKVLIQAITGQVLGNVIAAKLREENIAVTLVDAHGKDSDRAVLMIYSNRKGKDMIIEEIQKLDPQAMVVSNDVSTLQGGYISSWRKFVK